MNVLTYVAAILIIFAVIFYIIMELALGDDVPMFVKLFLPGFFILGAVVCILVSSFTSDNERTEIHSTGALDEMEPLVANERYCPLCHTKTDGPICPKCRTVQNDHV